MRMSRRLGVYGQGSGKAMVMLYGAPTETITLTDVKKPSNIFSVITNNKGKTETQIEIPSGIYIIKGSKSVEALPNGRTVIVDKKTTIVSAYPPGAIYWFGNGSQNGDTLWLGQPWDRFDVAGPEGVNITDGYTQIVSVSPELNISVNIPNTPRTCGGFLYGGQVSLAGYSYVTGLVYGDDVGSYFGVAPVIKKGFDKASIKNTARNDLKKYVLSSVALNSNWQKGQPVVGIYGGRYYSGNTKIKALWLDTVSASSSISNEGNTSPKKISVQSDTLRYCPQEGFNWTSSGTTNYFGNKGTQINSLMASIGTFNFNGRSKKLRISNFYCLIPSIDFAYSKGFRWAICKSDKSKALYQGTSEVTNDSEQIARGTAYLPYNNAKPKVYDLDLSASEIPSNIPLYLYLYSIPNSGVAHVFNSFSVSVNYLVGGGSN